MAYPSEATGTEEENWCDVSSSSLLYYLIIYFKYIYIYIIYLILIGKKIKKSVENIVKWIGGQRTISINNSSGPTLWLTRRGKRVVKGEVSWPAGLTRPP